MSIDRTSHGPVTTQRGLDLLAQMRNGKSLCGGVPTPIVFCARQAATQDPVSQTHALASEVAATPPQTTAGKGQPRVNSGLGSTGRMLKTAFVTSLLFGAGLTPAAALQRQLNLSVDLLPDLAKGAEETGGASPVQDLFTSVHSKGMSKYVVVIDVAEPEKAAAVKEIMSAAAKAGPTTVFYAPEFANWMDATFGAESSLENGVEAVPMGAGPGRVTVDSFLGKREAAGASSFALVRGKMGLCVPPSRQAALDPTRFAEPEICPRVGEATANLYEMGASAGIPKEVVDATAGAFPLALDQGKQVMLVMVSPAVGGNVYNPLADAMTLLGTSFFGAAVFHHLFPAQDRPAMQEIHQAVVGFSILGSSLFAGAYMADMFLPHLTAEGGLAHHYAGEGLAVVSTAPTATTHLTFVTPQGFENELQEFARVNAGRVFQAARGGPASERPREIRHDEA